MEASGPEKKRGESLIDLLKRHNSSFHPVVRILPEQKVLLLDLTSSNSALQMQNLQDTYLFNDFIFGLFRDAGAAMGAGGYLEKRIIYRRSEVFSGNEIRCIHLGIDIWGPAGTPVFAPLKGMVHSYQDNMAFGDYGPTIILQHELENTRFYTLYGHLSRQSLDGLKTGQLIQKGENFTELGPFPENGDWPPHLHFQIIADMEGRKGDFPGVAAPSELEKYKAICPDPNLILNLPILNYPTS